MALIAGTQTTYDIKGIREDLNDVIYRITPEETPFLSSIQRYKADATFHEWQTDTLAAVDTANAQLEGDDASFATPAATARVGNYTQISRKTLILSDTEEEVNKAGRKSEEAYQMSKRGVELKRDIEAICVGTNQGANAGAIGTARKSGSILAWLKTNTDFGATGVDPVYTTAPTGVRTDGTQRAFTEVLLKSEAQEMWSNGADLKFLMLGGPQKQVFSAFAGVATKTFNKDAEEPTAIIGAADVYVTDFGKLSVFANRYQRNRDAIFYDPKYFGIAWLRPIRRKVLGASGDAEKRLLRGEWTLRCNNEGAHAIIADLT